MPRREVLCRRRQHGYLEQRSRRRKEDEIRSMEICKRDSGDLRYIARGLLGHHSAEDLFSTFKTISRQNQDIDRGLTDGIVSKKRCPHLVLVRPAAETRARAASDVEQQHKSRILDSHSLSLSSSLLLYYPRPCAFIIVYIILMHPWRCFSRPIMLMLTCRSGLSLCQPLVFVCCQGIYH